MTRFCPGDRGPRRTGGRVRGLAHQSLRTILLVLLARGGEMASGDIAARVDCSWPTTTRHLRILEDAALVRLTPPGRQHPSKLAPPPRPSGACARPSPVWPGRDRGRH